MIRELDQAWLSAHPLPSLCSGKDKSERGSVLAIGGSRLVPGAMLLTGEAVLRVGAGKVKIATVESVAIALGVRMPEAAIVALKEDAAGEVAQLTPITSEPLEDDVVLVGPGMMACNGIRDNFGELLQSLKKRTLLLDAGAMQLAGGFELPFATVMTPHRGEMAKLLERPKAAIDAGPAKAALDAAQKYGAVIVLKDAETFIAEPNGQVLRFSTECPGLGTAGSGDVLAGVIAGLAAQGLTTQEAAAWGAFIHAEAGKRASRKIGMLGFLARELLVEVPAVRSDQR